MMGSDIVWVIYLFLEISWSKWHKSWELLMHYMITIYDKSCTLVIPWFVGISVSSENLNCQYYNCVSSLTNFNPLMLCDRKTQAIVVVSTLFVQGPIDMLLYLLTRERAREELNPSLSFYIQCCLYSLHFRLLKNTGFYLIRYFWQLTALIAIFLEMQWIGNNYNYLVLPAWWLLRRVPIS